MIGILAIAMSGGVYCPLSPRDPQHRLEALLVQTKSTFILVHHITKTKFQANIISIDIECILFTDDIISANNVNLLTNIFVTPNNIAYIIFTSGSTGTPKAVSTQINIFFER